MHWDCSPGGTNPSDRQSAARGDITLEAETKDLKFVSTLAEGIEIPYGTRLEGKFTMAGTKMGTDLLLMQPEAQAVVAADTIPITVYNDSISVADDFKMERAARLFAKYDLSRDRYEADLAVNHFDLHQFMPADSLYTLSTRLKVEGKVLTFFSPYLFQCGGRHRPFPLWQLSSDRNFIGCRTGEIEGACFTGSEKLDHGYQGAFGWYLETS